MSDHFDVRHERTERLEKHVSRLRSGESVHTRIIETRMERWIFMGTGEDTLVFVHDLAEDMHPHLETGRIWR